MKIDLNVDSGPCNTELRGWCIGIAVYSLISVVLSVIAGPTTITFIGLAISIIANVCLLLGSQKYNHWLVGVWLIYAILYAIGTVIAIFGAILHFGGYREATGSSNIFIAVFIYLILFILMAFCTRLVYSFYLQLKNRKSNPQHAVVI